MTKCPECGSPAKRCWELLGELAVESRMNVDPAIAASGLALIELMQQIERQVEADDEVED